MKWQTKNHLGEVVTWYSEDEYNKLKEENEELKTNLEKARVMNPYINCKNCKKEQKLKKVEDRIQDIKFDDEHNIEIMNDILQIIESEGANNE